MSHTEFQQVLIKPEATFGAGVAGDFSGATGMRVYPSEKLSMDNLTQKLEATSNVVSSWSELPPLPSATFKEGTLTLKHPLSGNTRAAGVVTEDFQSKLLALILGTRSFSAKEAAAAGCSVTSIVVAGAGTYVAGELIMINGEVRIVDTWTLATKTITVKIPLSAIPGAADVLYGVEKFDTSGDVSTFAMGLQHDFSAQDILLLGCLAKTFGVEGLTNADKVQITTEIEAADHTIGSALVSPVSTNEVPNTFVTCAAGGHVCMVDNADALLELVPKSVELGNPISEVFVDSISGINGKKGHERLPGAEPIKITLTCYETGTLMASLIAALVKENQLIVQVGIAPGFTVGIALKECFISEYPKFADADKKLYIKFTVSGSGLSVFRA
jgi:hypothetical protein